MTVSGAGSLVGVENGDEADLTSFTAAEHVVFNGHLSVVVRAKPGTTGPIRVKVEAAGVQPVEVDVSAVKRYLLLMSELKLPVVEVKGVADLWTI